ncbi:MAG: hypothetical protein ACE5IJ_09275 [Thermoplasmata archaeon]
MAWYQRAKDKARIGELEAELGQIKGRHVELVNTLRDVLAKLRQGAVDDATRLLGSQYQVHKEELEGQRDQDP